MSKNINLTQFLRSLVLFCLLSVTSLFIAGCQTGSNELHGFYKQGLPGTAKWAVLPFIAHTNMPEYMNIQLEHTLAVQLPSRGIKSPEIYLPPESETVSAYSKAAIALWSNKHRIRFSISGEILEWETNAEGHFSVMMNLKVVDVASGLSIWDMNGFGKGQLGEDPYDVSRKLLIDLVNGIPVDRQK